VRLAGEVTDGVLLDASAGPDDIRQARELLDEGRAATGRGGRGRLIVYAQADPRGDDLRSHVADRIAAVHAAGADSVILQGPGDLPDPRPLLEVLDQARAPDA